MKKIFILLGLGCAVFNQANAQHIKLGPEAGLNLFSMSSRFDGDHESNRLIPGLKLGGVIDFGITRHFSIQPGLYFSMKGFSQKTSDRTTVGNTTTTVTDKYRMGLGYIEMPVNFLYKSRMHHSGQFFAGGGPYLAALVGGKIKTDHTRTISNDNGSNVTHSSDSYSVNIGDNAQSDDVRGADAGINMNAGYEFRNGLFLRGNLGVGLANIMPEGDSDYSMHNVGMSFTVGYFFRVH